MPLDSTKVRTGSNGSRKRITVALVILNTVVIATCFVTVRAYGYRLKTAVRAAPFKTIGPLPETSNPAFDPQATLSADSRTVTVTGPYACLPTEGESVVTALVSQETTGAFARGSTRGACTGQAEQFSITAPVPEGTPGFQEGRIKIEALGLNRRGTTDFTFTDFIFWGRYAQASKGKDTAQANQPSTNVR